MRKALFYLRESWLTRYREHPIARYEGKPVQGLGQSEIDTAETTAEVAVWVLRGAAYKTKLVVLFLHLRAWWLLAAGQQALSEETAICLFRARR